jgi:hypothetical protein
VTTKPLWQRRSELGTSVVQTPRLYLDLRFWNDLCDTALGQSDSAGELLDLMQTLRADEAVVCPIEANVLVELLKQKDNAKQRMTASLVDDLSGGVAMVSPQERVFLECLRLVQAVPKGPPFPVAPIREMWTRPAHLAGHVTAPPVPQDVLDAAGVDVAMADERAWSMTFLEVIDEMRDLDAPAWTESTAERLNASKTEARTLFPSYQRLYLEELQGYFEAVLEQLGDVLEYLFYAAHPNEGPLSKAQHRKAGVSLAFTLFQAMKLHGLERQLPSAHINATLFASWQWDGPRKYRPNDFWDFGHAAAALPYCDAFATERPLSSALLQANLTETYSCKVFSTTDLLLDWLESLRGC